MKSKFIDEQEAVNLQNVTALGAAIGECREAFRLIRIGKNSLESGISKLNKLGPKLELDNNACQQLEDAIEDVLKAYETLKNKTPEDYRKK